jgi:hypothetical protein
MQQNSEEIDEIQTDFGQSQYLWEYLFLLILLIPFACNFTSSDHHNMFGNNLLCFLYISAPEIALYFRPCTQQDSVDKPSHANPFYQTIYTGLHFHDGVENVLGRICLIKNTVQL